MYRDASHLRRSFSYNRTKINIQFLNELFWIIFYVVCEAKQHIWITLSILCLSVCQSVPLFVCLSVRRSVCLLVSRYVGLPHLVQSITRECLTSQTSNLVGRLSLISWWSLLIFRSVGQRSRSKVILIPNCWGGGISVLQTSLVWS